MNLTLSGISEGALFFQNDSLHALEVFICN